MAGPEFPKAVKNKMSIPLDLRVVVVVLLVVIAGMFFVWKPWATKVVNDRTVQVSGQATITAKPDEFVFNPSYAFKNADKTAALTAMTAKSNEIVAKLKDLKVADKDIKTNSSGYDNQIYYYGGDGQATYTLQLTVTTHDTTAAQKVQDYLVSTSPTGAVSPQATFSDAKRKELETQARNEAAKDARSKADQMAKNVGFKVIKVKSLTDDQGFNNIIRPMYTTDSKALSTQEATPSLPVQPGENDLPYSITVEYYIK